MIDDVKHDPEAKAWPIESLETLGQCPLCATVERRLLHADLEDRLYFSAPGRWQLYACAACGAAYLDPRPCHSAIHLAYKKYFTHCESVADEPARHSMGVLGSFRQLVKSQYIRLCFGPTPDLFANVLCLPLFLMPRLRAAFNGVMRHLPRPRAGDTLLDIGCGSGRFMALARVAGWTCVGTEVDPVAANCARSRGFEVHLGDVSDLEASGAKYGAITISHVIEHVHEPLALLSAAQRLLVPGGFFWIETPNITSHGHECFGRHWRDLDPPRHLQLFHHALLQRLLMEAGFVEIQLAPWHVDWLATLPASVQLAEQAGVKLHSESTFLLGEAVGRANPLKREFVTLVARAPGEQPTICRSNDGF